MSDNSALTSGVTSILKSGRDAESEGQNRIGFGAYSPKADFCRLQYV
jgi:hypothetical protein